MRSAAAIALGAFSTLATAADVGYAGVENLCDFDVYTWYVGGNVSDMHVNPAKAGFIGEDYRWDPESGGRVFKMSLEEDGLYTGAPQLNMAYTLDGPRVWYDMSEVFGSPFEGHELWVRVFDDGCEDITWEDGVSPGGSSVRTCSSDVSFTLILCNENNNRK